MISIAKRFNDPDTPRSRLFNFTVRRFIFQRAFLRFRYRSFFFHLHTYSHSTTRIVWFSLWHLLWLRLCAEKRRTRISREKKSLLIVRQRLRVTWLCIQCIFHRRYTIVIITLPISFYISGCTQGGINERFFSRLYRVKETRRFTRFLPMSLISGPRFPNGVMRTSLGVIRSIEKKEKKNTATRRAPMSAR